MKANTAGRAGRFLENLLRLVDFAPIEAEQEKLYPTKRGRPSHPLRVLFKMMLLENCYNLSDPEVEAQVTDRLSFRRFVGLSLEAAVPNETALVRFCARLVAAGLGETLLDRINTQIGGARTDCEKGEHHRRHATPEERGLPGFKAIAYNLKRWSNLCLA